MRHLPALLVALVASACASAPPAASIPPPPPAPTFQQKMAAILRLEDHRVLRDPTAAATSPDLVRLLGDDEARVRRRAAMAVGRVGLAEGEPLLVGLLRDADPEVRQMAAFALGLLGDTSARDPLIAALSDPSPLVQGSAAEALGLIGDPGAADAIGRLASQIVQSGALAETPGDQDDARRDTPAAAFRLGIYALVRLKAYPQLAAAALDADGQPRVHWWPVAFALQRLDDPRALPALLTFAKDSNPYARAFAVKGLGALKNRAALPVLMPLLTSGDRNVLVETIRALGRIGDAAAAEPLLKIIRDASADPHARLEAAGAIGGVHPVDGPSATKIYDALLDMLTDSSAAMRGAALRSLATFDAANFVAVLSGLDPDQDWEVRASLATVLGTLPSDVGLRRLQAMLPDTDQRVVPLVLASLVKIKAPNAAAILLERLKADDMVVRAAAATGLGELKVASAPPALAEAYAFGQRDPNYAARAAALAAIAKFGAAVATPVLKSAFADKDWAVRVRAAMLLKELDPAAAAGADMQIRPAPTTVTSDVYMAPGVVDPPVSTQVYLDTDRGTIQIELAVLDAPLTTLSFVTLARKGYFDGLPVHRVVPDFVMQDGDPRGDGEGGPGYSIRDEINQRPYLRGTVGMALDPWPDTGGSQYFITHSPQPHLDAKYTVFGRVIAGMDVVDQIQQGDIIRRVRVWDGEQMTR